MSVGENLKMLRKRRGLTQEELSRKSRISESMICRIERGQKMPSLASAQRLADALAVQLNEIVG